MKLSKHLICIMLIMTMSNVINAQNLPIDSKKVFFIGENEDLYHELTAEYNSSLLEVCDNSMELSYQTWSSLMKNIESFCSKNDYDIRGAKLWMNIFWDETGQIKHIIFHPKPNSKKMDYDQLVNLLSKFIETSPNGQLSSEKYSHYGSISFPVFTYQNLAKEK